MNQVTSVEISFIIVNWNTRDYLQKCLTSLYRGISGIQYEIIVVDNASCDGSIEMLQENFPEVHVIRNKSNLGFSGANNQGIKTSKGEYICLVNSDVVVFKNTISMLHEYIETHPCAGIVGPKVLNSDFSLQPSCRTFPTILSSLFRAFKLDTRFKKSALFGRHFLTNWNYNDTREVEILSGCFWMIRRAALEKIGLLDTQFFIYGEDMDLCKRFHTAGWKLIFCHSAVILHYGGASSSKDPKRFWVEMQKANLQYWLKHHHRVKVLMYYTCLVLHNSLRILAFSAQRIITKKLDEKSIARMETCRAGLNWLLSKEIFTCFVLGA